MTNLSLVDNDLDRHVHVFFNGQAWDLDFDNLDVGLLSSDADIRNKVADALNVPSTKLANFTVDRNEETESLTLRPAAQFA